METILIKDKKERFIICEIHKDCFFTSDDAQGLFLAHYKPFIMPKGAKLVGLYHAQNLPISFYMNRNFRHTIKTV